MRTAIATSRGLFLTCLLLAALASLGACSRGGGDAPDEVVQVFAAASLADVLEAARAMPDVPAFEFHVAGSELLWRQVQAGAPADLVILARALTPEERAQGGAAATLVHSRLVVAVRKDAEDLSAGVADLSRLRRLALADPDFAPAGRYARAALTDAGAWEALEPALMFASNVRDACSWVVLGEAEAVVCYRSDVTALDGLEEAFPLGDDPVPYDALVVAPVPRRPAAEALLAALGGPALDDTYRRFGFEPSGR